ncbi:MAG TPA: NADH:flavin oxidoreductase [Chthoniobacteraceae bacterium]|nr:NADH:flavin oxidoreductase [Chthoniobacteraceae bacterium]
MSKLKVARLASLKSTDDFRRLIDELGLDLEFSQLPPAGQSALLQPAEAFGKTIGNRWAIHPMEGWDGTTSGGTTDIMLRRWQRFGQSGAKLIWGGEAMAVRPDGRANPNQIIIQEANKKGIAGLREALVAAHEERYGKSDDLVIGFQLTHSGRFCRPHEKTRWESMVAYNHPILDKKFSVTRSEQVMTDDQIRVLIDDYIRAAKIAREVGADFVDIKHCHGYLLHEFLSAHTRPGPYGGSFENRTRITREIIEGIAAEVPGLGIGVRLSAFDLLPYRPDPALSVPGSLGPGIPEEYPEGESYPYAFGVDPNDPTRFDLCESRLFLEMLEKLGVRLVNLSAGSPYYNPHIQRPASYPPSDGYGLLEDPLVGVARQVGVVRKLKEAFPNLLLVGSGYSYLQEFLPHVAEHNVANGWVDFVGIGRMVLSYPEVVADSLEGKTLQKRFICRTFSDCTTAPRNGLRSGCYPLDDYYKVLEDAALLKKIKKGG